MNCPYICCEKTHDISHLNNTWERYGYNYKSGAFSCSFTKKKLGHAMKKKTLDKLHTASQFR